MKRCASSAGLLVVGFLSLCLSLPFTPSLECDWCDGDGWRFQYFDLLVIDGIAPVPCVRCKAIGRLPLDEPK